jgi:protein O-mannosyl-transferase
MKPVPKKQATKPVQKKTEPKFELPDAKKWGIIIGLVVFTFILYGNTIMHDYALDDDIITRRNEFVQQGVSGIGHIFSKGFLYGFNRANDQSYRPITLTSIAIEKQIWGNNPHVHHFFNVFWYAITAIFLFLTLLKIFRKYNFIVPLLITLLFIAHPVHTEVVANIKSRDEILSFLLCILALYCSVQYYSFKMPKYYQFLSWIFFFMAILSKETVLMYAVIIPMVYYYFTDFDLKKIIILTIPYGAIVILYMIIRGHVLDSITFNEQMEVINNTLMAAKNSADRLATTIFILGKYIWLLFVPITLSWDYSYNQIPIVSFSSIQALMALLVYGGLITYAFMRLKKKDPVSFGIFYFIITMALVSNLFVKIGSSMGERFLYTSSLGFCVAIAFLLIRLLKVKIDVLRPNLVTLYSVAGVLLLAFSVKTIARNMDWQNNYALFESGVTTSPNSARAHQSMAITYTDTANKTTNPVDKNNFFNKATTEYYASLKILPNYTEALYNMGWNFYSMGNYDSAAVAFQKCINADRRYVAAYQNLGVIYFNKKDYGRAIPIFEQALSVSQNNADIYGNLGAAFFNIGRFDSCIHYSQKALEINPGMASARSNMEKAQNILRNNK